MKLVTLTTPDDLLRIEAAPGLPVLAPDLPQRQNADAHLVVKSDVGIQARCSLWWTNAPPLPEGRAGVIGHYAAISDGAAAALLEGAVALLARHSCDTAIGPMDGNTWRKYRFVTEPGDAPPFFLEPANPPEWPRQWEWAGFQPLAHYFSAVSDDTAQHDDRLEKTAARLRKIDLRIRPFNTDNFAKELETIHRISLEAFAHNFLYTPLPLQDMLEQYEPVRPLIHPEFCLIAEDDTGPAGFIFALPDPVRMDDTVILKTVAVRPGRAHAGLGALLIGQVHQAAERAGIRRIIHALMHETNQSRNVSSRYARVFRRYTLFSRTLP